MEMEYSFSSLSRIFIILIGFIIVFIFPYGYHVDNGPGPNGFMAITWELPETENSILLLSALEYFIYYLYRLVVLYAIWKFSLGEMKTKRLIRHGLIAELIPILISIPGVWYLSSDGEGFIPVMIPIPFLLLFTILLAVYKYRTDTPHNSTRT